MQAFPHVVILVLLSYFILTSDCFIIGVSHVSLMRNVTSTGHLFAEGIENMWANHLFDWWSFGVSPSNCGTHGSFEPYSTSIPDTHLCECTTQFEGAFCDQHKCSSQGTWDSVNGCVCVGAVGPTCKLEVSCNTWKSLSTGLNGAKGRFDIPGKMFRHLKSHEIFYVIPGGLGPYDSRSVVVRRTADGDHLDEWFHPDAHVFFGPSLGGDNCLYALPWIETGSDTLKRILLQPHIRELSSFNVGRAFTTDMGSDVNIACSKYLTTCYIDVTQAGTYAATVEFEQNNCIPTRIYSPLEITVPVEGGLEVTRLVAFFKDSSILLRLFCPYGSNEIFFQTLSFDESTYEWSNPAIMLTFNAWQSPYPQRMVFEWDTLHLFDVSTRGLLSIVFPSPSMPSGTFDAWISTTIPFLPNMGYITFSHLEDAFYFVHSENESGDTPTTLFVYKPCI